MIEAFADREWFESKADYLLLRVGFSNKFKIIYREKIGVLKILVVKNNILHPSPTSYQQPKIYHL